MKKYLTFRIDVSLFEMTNERIFIIFPSPQTVRNSYLVLLICVSSLFVIVELQFTGRVNV